MEAFANLLRGDARRIRVAQRTTIPPRDHVYWDPANELLVDEKKTLLCPICKKPYYAGRIFQCPDGHLFCSICVNSNKRVCPNRMCRRTVSTMKTIRNRRLESIVVENPTVLEMTRVASQCPSASSEASQGQGHTAPITVHTHANGIAGICQHCLEIVYQFGARFKCLMCRGESNICQPCVYKGQHPEKHALILIMTPEQSDQAIQLIAVGAKPVRTRGRGSAPQQH